MTYDTFLGKIDAIGINPTYALLLFGSSGESVISFLKGTDFSAPGRYTKMNDLFGWALVLGVVFGLRYFWRDDAHYLRSNVVFLILLFVAIFGFFSVIEIDPESYGAFFMWPAIIVLPGAVLFGGAVARRGSLSVMLILLLAAASLWSGERLRTTMLGQPSISARLSPAFLKYPDGQYAEARAYFETCDLCAKDIAPVLTEIGIFDGNNPGALKPGDAGEHCRGRDGHWRCRISADGKGGRAQDQLGTTDLCCEIRTLCFRSLNWTFHCRFHCSTARAPGNSGWSTILADERHA